MTDIAFIGFGEAARAIVQGWRSSAEIRIAAYDIKLDGNAADEIHDACSGTGVICADTPAAALSQAQHVFCLVTADQAVSAARQSARHLRPGTLWFDGNSCAPDSKREAAKIVADAGGVYVDLAIMAPIHPGLHKTPMLVAGPKASLAILDRMEMQYRYRGTGIGSASAVKMIRSIMIKGMEALSAECFLAARRADVLEDVLASLHSSDPQTDWHAKAGYNLERMMRHGLRRAAEMREVEATIAGLGLPADLASATVGWQQRIGELALRGCEGDVNDRLQMIDEAICSSATSAI